MSILDPAVIKKIVRSNFDKSAELYEQFEDEYGLFEFLTRELASQSEVQPGMNICDIGCGTGTSSFMLSDLVGPTGSVLGIDFSEEMLKIATEKLKVFSRNNIKFICSDASELDEQIEFELDSVLYNACIFLIPEPINTLNASYQKLAPGGTVGMNYLIGIFDSDSEGSESMNLFNLVRQSDQPYSPYGRAINNPSKLPETLSEIGFTNVVSGSISKEMSTNELKAFYSIPAQSAALWPKNSLSERLSNLDSFIEFLDVKNIKKYYQHWGWCIGVK